MKKTLAAMFALAIAAGTAFADYTSGTVSGLSAKQRYPWNGLVDISFTLSGPDGGYNLAFAATNSATGDEIPVRTVRDSDGAAVNATTEFAPGAVSLVWDAGADAPETVIDDLALYIVTAPLPGVQLWEGGPYWAETNIGADEPWEYGLYFCDWTWTTMNGVNGYIVRVRDDFSEASIFLPAAGSGHGTSLSSAGSYGYYWSSVPTSDYDISWGLYFDSGYHDAYDYYRNYGQSVRPVLSVAE